MKLQKRQYTGQSNKPVIFAIELQEINSDDKTIMEFY